MRKTGNGLPELCANNLLRIRRGEVAYERVKGIDGSLIDMPSEEAKDDAAEDAERQIEIFEPRIEVDSIETIGENDAGSFEFDINIHRKEETSES